MALVSHPIHYLYIRLPSHRLIKYGVIVRLNQAEDDFALFFDQMLLPATFVNPEPPELEPFASPETPKLNRGDRHIVKIQFMNIFMN